jgi:hypothetical protein
MFDFYEDTKKNCAFIQVRKVINGLARLDHEQQCELLYFDESGFSPNPSVQYGWGRIDQTRAVTPLTHRQRVNVLGALRHDDQVVWTTQQRPTTRDDLVCLSKPRFARKQCGSYTDPYERPGSGQKQTIKHTECRLI